MFGLWLSIPGRALARPSHVEEKAMTPHPKRKHSKGRRDRRRAHDALGANNLVACSNCGSMRLPHTICPNCGHYQGREVFEVKKEKKKAA
jgi:large subunit ribosomal protein L32